MLTFGAALINSVQDVMPAYGVKASWKDETEGNTHNLFSEYGLATTAIKPLSYAFLKDFKVNLPGEEKLQNLLNKIFNKINTTINLNMPDFSDVNINFGTIDISSIDTKITVNFQYVLQDADGKPLYILVTNKAGQLEWYWVGGDQTAVYYNPSDGSYYYANGTVVEFQQLTIDKNIDIDLYNTLKEIIDKVNAQWTSAQNDLTKMLNEIQKLNNINNQINASISNIKNDVKSELSKLISRAYNKLNSIFSSAPNRALQPVLVAKTGDKIKLLSRSMISPTKVSGSSLTLYPTSFSLELLAPAYKKFVAVTDVWNADGTEAAASIGQAANGENMKTVIDSEKSCTMNGQAGYIYEISYSAVDYHGKVTTKKFYVQF